MKNTNIIKRLESRVHSYCRDFPEIFTKVQGAILENDTGERFIDFLAGAGALNYGHNNPVLKKKLLEYIESDGITHGLDLATDAKRKFMETFESLIMLPRNMEYKLQFTGPTGTNAVEAALKIVRNVTGRPTIVSFTRGFHGVTLGSVAATGNSHFRDGCGIQPQGTVFMPYDGYMGDGIDTTEYLDKMLTDGSSGLDHPAAVIVETIQGEGGVNVASYGWLRSLECVCQKHDILMIVDDVQMGCGRTGTFRGNNLAFVTAMATLEHYWCDKKFSNDVKRKGQIIRNHLEKLVSDDSEGILSTRGRGMIQALDCKKGELASMITATAFEKGVIIETSGSDGEVIKFLMPLTITDEQLNQGLCIIEESVQEVMGSMSSRISSEIDSESELEIGVMT